MAEIVARINGRAAVAATSTPTPDHVVSPMMTSSVATSSRSAPGSARDVARCKRLVHREDVSEHHQQTTTRQTTRHHEGVGSLTERSMSASAAGACAARPRHQITENSTSCVTQNSRTTASVIYFLNTSKHNSKVSLSILFVKSVKMSSVWHREFIQRLKPYLYMPIM